MLNRAVSLLRSRSASFAVLLLTGLSPACNEALVSSLATNAAQGITVAVSPAVASLVPSGTQAFEATVTGTAATTVTWSVSDCGAISSTGLYSAPNSPNTCHVVATSTADTTKTSTATVTVADTGWQPLKVGAGGWVTGIDACAAGTTFALRTDTLGGYVGNPNTGAMWQQAVRTDTMSASFVSSFATGSTQTLGEGVYELRVAPSDCNRLYMAYRKKIFKSTNRGATWTETSFSYSGAMDPNDSYRMWGEKMAVDPANPDVVYVGTPSSGLFVTTNGGTSWSAVSGVPAATHGAGFTGIAFDPSSGTSGGRTNTIYAVRNGAGVYRSTNAGTSWAQLSGGPTTVTHAAIAADGVYYAVNMGTVVHKYAGGAWGSSADTGVQLHTVSTDPFNAARVIAGRDSGHLVVSTDRGASWGTGVIWGVGGQMKRVAADVPWLAFANESYMSSGAQRFDPTVPNKLWFTEGIGVWYSTDPGNTTQTTWNSYSAGIEQLVGRDVCVPPGTSTVALAGMDRSVWVVPRSNASYPSQYVTMGSSNSLIAAWAVNYSVANPSHLVAVINRGLSGEPELSGYSLDGGATWTKFPVQPGTGGQSGDIIATSIDNIIAVIGTKYAYRSTDRGASWTKLSLPGDSGADTNNLHPGYVSTKHVLAVDGANPHTIYLYFYSHGIYRSLDDGGTWSLVNAGAFDGTNMYWQTKLRSVPGQAGHLFLTAGQAGGEGTMNPSNTHLYRSTDGGVTWTTMAGFTETYDVALGKAAPGQSYPAIYVVGWYNSVYGIWRSIDNTATWTQIGPYPSGSVDQINVIKASQDTYGDIYVTFQGSGWGHGKIQ